MPINDLDNRQIEQANYYQTIVKTSFNAVILIAASIIAGAFQIRGTSLNGIQGVAFLVGFLIAFFAAGTYIRYRFLLKGHVGL